MQLATALRVVLSVVDNDGLVARTRREVSHLVALFVRKRLTPGDRHDSRVVVAGAAELAQKALGRRGGGRRLGAARLFELPERHQEILAHSNAG